MSPSSDFIDGWLKTYCDHHYGDDDDDVQGEDGVKDLVNDGWGREDEAGA